MAKEKKEKAKAVPKGPRKAGKYKTTKVVVTEKGEVRATPQKEKKVAGPVCSLSETCKFARIRKVDKDKSERRCSIGIIEKGHCNYPKWGKHMRSSDFARA